MFVDSSDINETIEMLGTIVNNSHKAINACNTFILGINEGYVIFALSKAIAILEELNKFEGKDYLEGYKKGLEDGKDILIKEIKERLEEKKRRSAGIEESKQ